MFADITSFFIFVFVFQQYEWQINLSMIVRRHLLLLLDYWLELLCSSFFLPSSERCLGEMVRKIFI